MKIIKTIYLNLININKKINNYFLRIIKKLRS